MSFDWMAVFAGAVFAGLALLWIYTRITNRDVGGAVSVANDTLAALQQLTRSLAEVYPSETANTVLAIFDIASVATAQAEQLWLTGMLGKNERNEAARNYVYVALETMGVEITDSIKTIVDGAIEAVCLMEIPHA